MNLDSSASDKKVKESVRLLSSKSLLNHVNVGNNLILKANRQTFFFPMHLKTGPGTLTATPGKWYEREKARNGQLLFDVLGDLPDYSEEVLLAAGYMLNPTSRMAIRCFWKRCTAKIAFGQQLAGHTYPSSGGSGMCLEDSFDVFMCQTLEPFSL